MSDLAEPCLSEGAVWADVEFAPCDVLAGRGDHGVALERAGALLAGEVDGCGGEWVGDAWSPRDMLRLRACWTVQAPLGWAVMPARNTWRRPSSMKNSTYSRCSLTVSTWKKSPANTPDACEWRNSVHDGPRRGAGPRRSARMMLRTEVADTATPSLEHSPTIRMYPQRGFSRPRRTTSAMLSWGDRAVAATDVGSSGGARAGDAIASRWPG